MLNKEKIFTIYNKKCRLLEIQKQRLQISENFDLPDKNHNI
jgi:hypothetical protein